MQQKNIAQPQGAMQMVIIPQEIWEKLMDTIEEIKILINEKQSDSAASEWVPSLQARKMLGVSGRTWQDYRDKRVIPFTQFGRKIFCKRGDLQKFMESHYIKERGRK
jgi:hypothetical protein